jgi:hypothetical protein
LLEAFSLANISLQPHQEAASSIELSDSGGLENDLLTQKVSALFNSLKRNLRFKAVPWFLMFPFAIFTVPSILINLEQLLHLNHSPVFPDN